MPNLNRYKATVVGFSDESCPLCYGRGRAGWLVGQKEQGRISPCRCVQYFDMESVQRAKEEHDAKVKAGESENGVTKRTDGHSDEGVVATR